MMNKKTILIGLLLIISLASFAQIDPTVPLQRDPSIKYGKLHNGLTYYIMHNDKPAGRADFYLLTDVGAIQESPEQNGLAHFLEHMCLNGTENFPGKMMIDYLESIGASFGDNINASTGVEQTMYMLNNIPVTREGVIDTALLIMHDFSGFVTNSPDEIDKERGVIIEEWRTRNTADWRVYEKSLGYLYGGSKYASCNIIGTKENLESFPAEQLEKFYKTWYRPDLQAVVVVGDIDSEQIYSKLEKIFKDIPPQENPEQKEEIQIPDNEKPVIGIITDPEQTSTSIEIMVKSEPLPRDVRESGIGLLNDLAQSLISLILNERYADIYTKPDTPFIQAQGGFYNLTNTLDAFTISVYTKDGEALTGFRAALTELERAKRYGFSQEEYERAVKNLRTAFEMAANNKGSRKNAELVAVIQSDFFDGDIAMDPDYLLEQIDLYLSGMDVTLLNQVIASIDYMTNDVVLYVAPQKENLTHPTEDDFLHILSDIPSSEIMDVRDSEVNMELLDDDSLIGSKIVKETAGGFSSTVWTLANGIKVVIRPSDLKKDEVLMLLSVDGGKSVFTEEEALSLDDNFQSFYSISGVSEFPFSVLNKKMAGITATVTPYIGELGYGFEGGCAPKDVEKMMQLIYLYCVDPRFERDEMMPLLSQMEAVLPNLVNDPSYKVSSEYYKTAYKSPRKQQISMESFSKFDFDTFAGCYRKLFSNMAGATMYIAGNVDLDVLKPMVEKYIGSLPVSDVPNTYVDNNLEIVTGMVTNEFATDMETPKTTVLLTYSGDIEYTKENCYYMDALQYVLNLIYTSTMREEEGATYGVGVAGSISIRPNQRGMLIVQFDTNPNLADRMIRLARKGVEDVAKNGVSEEQFSKVVENLLKRIQENRIDNSYWMNALLMDSKYGFDIDTDCESDIRSLRADKLKEFTMSLLCQGNLVTLVMNPVE